MGTNNMGEYHGDEWMIEAELQERLHEYWPSQEQMDDDRRQQEKIEQQAWEEEAAKRDAEYDGIDIDLTKNTDLLMAHLNDLKRRYGVK